MSCFAFSYVALLAVLSASQVASISTIIDAEGNVHEDSLTMRKAPPSTMQNLAVDTDGDISEIQMRKREGPENGEEEEDSSSEEGEEALLQLDGKQEADVDASVEGELAKLATKEQADVATLRGRLEGLSKRLAAANADAKRKKEAYEAAASTASKLEQEKKELHEHLAMMVLPSDAAFLQETLETEELDDGTSSEEAEEVGADGSVAAEFRNDAEQNRQHILKAKVPAVQNSALDAGTAAIVDALHALSAKNSAMVDALHAGDKKLGEHCYASKRNECEPGLKCLGQKDVETWNGLCLDKKTYCDTYKFSHYGTHESGDWTGKCPPAKSSRSSGGVQLPTDLKFDTPIQIMCIGDSITRGGHGGEIRDPDEEIDVPQAVPDTDAEGEEVPGAAEGRAKIYHKEFTLEKANYCSKMGIMLDGADDIDVYNLGVSGATAQTGTDIPWVKQPAYDDYKKHYRCDVAIVQLGTNDAKEEYWDGGANYKKAYKNLLQNDIMKKCELVLLGLPPPTQCSSDSCRFGDPSSSGGLGDGDICCPDAWESADVINVELPDIVMQIAEELNLPTIPFREAIGEYHNGVLNAIRSYELADQIHPNEFGYLEMARQAKKVLDPILKKSLKKKKKNL